LIKNFFSIKKVHKQHRAISQPRLNKSNNDLFTFAVTPRRLVLEWIRKWEGTQESAFWLFPQSHFPVSGGCFAEFMPIHRNIPQKRGIFNEQ
jgi:hypothetical protein